MLGIDGVSGGVYAGEIRLCGTPGVPGCEVFSRSAHPDRYCAEGRGSGDITGEAWEGSDLGVSMVVRLLIAGKYALYNHVYIKRSL